MKNAKRDAATGKSLTARRLGSAALAASARRGFSLVAEAEGKSKARIATALERIATAIEAQNELMLALSFPAGGWPHSTRDATGRLNPRYLRVVAVPD